VLRIVAAAGIAIALVLGALVAVGYWTSGTPPPVAELRHGAVITTEFPASLDRPLPAGMRRVPSGFPVHRVPSPLNAPDQRGMPHLIIVPANGGTGTLELRPR
jgi:hypothetical protein